MSPGFYHYINVAMALRRSQTIAAIVIGSLLGITLGVGTFTFVYARGASYLTNDPRACANCHIMNEQYDGWVKSSHRQAAVCNDCHAPHDFIGKYSTKALNGFLHSYAFTTNDFHEPIQITERNRRITEGACRHCHSDLVAQIDHAGTGGPPLLCIRCHPGVGHMELANVGSVPETDITR
jgi:cytochrome c nitrite reductase small subunit